MGGRDDTEWSVRTHIPVWGGEEGFAVVLFLFNYFFFTRSFLYIDRGLIDCRINIFYIVCIFQCSYKRKCSLGRFGFLFLHSSNQMNGIYWHFCSLFTHLFITHIRIGFLFGFVFALIFLCLFPQFLSVFVLTFCIHERSVAICNSSYWYYFTNSNALL